MPDTGSDADLILIRFRLMRARLALAAIQREPDDREAQRRAVRILRRSRYDRG